VPALLVLLLAAAYRPWIPSSDTRWTLDIAIGVTIAAALLQLIPLPSFVLDVVSPHVRHVWNSLSLNTPGALPISVDLDAGARALLIAAGCSTVFLTARRIFTTGGVRRVVRGVGVIGLVLSAVALAQDATAHGLMYWRWAPLEEGAPPFGPFVNRNHFATWAIMAIPLSVGYLAAHSAAHRHRVPAHVAWRRRLSLSFDARGIWLTVAIAIMVVAVLVSLSRSGMMGLAVALLGGALLHGRDLGSKRPRGVWLVAGLALTILLVLLRVDPAALGGRFASAHASAVDRFVIWRDTLGIIRDFPLTGTGAGTYETVMLVYQRSDTTVRFNQAHNQYLQFAADGGLLLCVPFAIAVAAYIREARKALMADLSGMYWLRAGAACGLAGVAAQCIWETGLATPANALVAAVAAAIVIHEPAHSSSHA
jgi:putative inorganic carbon (HCO3(-)) transporter